MHTQSQMGCSVASREQGRLYVQENGSVLNPPPTGHQREQLTSPGLLGVAGSLIGLTLARDILTQTNLPGTL